MFFLKLILNVWSIEKSFERVKQLEFSNDRIAIIKSLSQDRWESSFKLSDSLFEFIEIFLKSSLINVHDVIFDLHELVNGFLKLFMNLINGSC